MPVDLRPHRPRSAVRLRQNGPRRVRARASWRGVELVSTGGTRKALAEAGLAVKDIADLTGISGDDGRAASRPCIPRCMAACWRSAKIPSMKRRCWRMTSSRSICSSSISIRSRRRSRTAPAYDECVENIDIGGPAMIRAAAKNHDDVAVSSSIVADYAARPRCELDSNDGRDRPRVAPRPGAEGLCPHGGL